MCCGITGMDIEAYSSLLDHSWLTFRQQLLDAFPKSAAGPEPAAPELPKAGSNSSEPKEPKSRPSVYSTGHATELFRSSLEGRSEGEQMSIRRRLRLRLGVISPKALVSGKGLLDAVSALGLTRYTEEDANDMVNLLADFIDLEFEPELHKANQVNGLRSKSFDQGLGKPIWAWPKSDNFRQTAQMGMNAFAEPTASRSYNVVPSQPLIELFLAQESDVHRRIFGQRLLKQFQAMKEILLAGDTNRLVAELTFVRINDLAAPPEPIHPIMYLEPLVAVLIVGNGVMIGFQTDPSYKDWHGWPYVEIAFASFLVLEIFLRAYVLRCANYWCGSEKFWNWFDLFLAATGISDIAAQLIAQEKSDIAGTSLLRFCRLIRLVRIVKVFRIKIMRDLRLMVKGLIAGIRTLALAFILLFTVLYVISGFATMTIGSSERTTEIGLLIYFESIPASMFTAFRCFTGECVNDAGQPIHSLLASEFGLLFIMGYVASYMLVTMGIFNVILAVYVDITMKAAKENDALTAEQYSRESVRIARTTRELLKKFSTAYHTFIEDTDVEKTPCLKSMDSPMVYTEDGMDKVAISKELFLMVIQDRTVQTLMDELDLPHDRANLFEIIDADGSGTLQITELLQGLLKIRGEVSKSDTVATLLATKAVQSMVCEMKEESALLKTTLKAEMNLLQQMQQNLLRSLLQAPRLPGEPNPSPESLEDLPKADLPHKAQPKLRWEPSQHPEMLAEPGEPDFS
ncbi:unnamed protein product [Effrenium voratum]|uniref:EF-hand domain-containing protein n=1 Tax=Effrenium voratum TaxID=2562239 RepID=A0AA36J0J2_9DINO|nr:unnamed protein product [Effrenium voratum]CAJ1442480.1 unnamed protein product [Effrenium voratum]